MPPSNWALERANPPRRRKACISCVRAKRRCNLAQPSCSRCAQRRISCCYAFGTPDQSVPCPADSADAIAFESNVLVEARSLTAAGFPTRQSPRVGPMEADFDPETDAWDFLFEHGDRIGDEPVTLGSGLFQDFTLFPTQTVALCPLGLRTPYSFRLMTFQRFQYALEHIRRAPQQMAYENATPWCHAQLYRDAMPRAMQDAQACSALYAAKNRANVAAVLRTIEARVADLVAAPPPPEAEVSPLEALARCQALLLYQIMRLFDGDVRARAAAELTMPHLEAAAMALAPVAAEQQLPTVRTAAWSEDGACGLLPMYPLAGTRVFWEEWILRESARRTMIVVFVVVLTYRLLRSSAPIVCDRGVHGSAKFTASAYLWQAEDAVEFAVAWGQRKHFLVANTGLPGLLEEAEPDDIDTYGRILMTAILGVDETKGWFLSKGGAL